MSSTTRKPKEGEPLSRSELEIMRMICNGCRASDAARLLGLTRYASEDRVRSTLAKLGASTQAEAAYIIARRGLFDVQGPPKPTRALLRSFLPKRPPRSRKQRTQTAAPNSVFALGQM